MFSICAPANDRTYFDAMSPSQKIPYRNTADRTPIRTYSFFQAYSSRNLRRSRMSDAPPKTAVASAITAQKLRCGAVHGENMTNQNAKATDSRETMDGIRCAA